LSFFGVGISEFDRAHVAQLAEHVLGKDEVISSILIMGSILAGDCGQYRPERGFSKLENTNNQHQEIE
jgi:hypothetical protein